MFHGIIYYIGKSAKENWNLLDTSKKINNDYIWFHLNSFASPYVIMHATIKELDATDLSHISVNQYLQFGAELCKENSKYKFLKDVKIMYVPVNKLTKTENLGEVNVVGKPKLITINLNRDAQLQ